MSEGSNALYMYEFGHVKENQVMQNVYKYTSNVVIAMLLTVLGLMHIFLGGS